MVISCSPLWVDILLSIVNCSQIGDTMTAHGDVALAFVRQEKKHLKGSAMFFEGKVIYSWGRHFPLACWAGENVILFNVDGWSNSVSTRKHTNLVDYAISVSTALVVEVDLNTIQKYLRYDYARVKKEHEPKNILQAVEVLKFQLRRVANPHRVGYFIRKLKEQLKLFQFFEEL